MTNSEATYIYRLDIAEAIKRYRARLRRVFAAHGSPIPATPDCVGEWAEAWATCRVQFHRADIKLHFNRQQATQ